MKKMLIPLIITFAVFSFLGTACEQEGLTRQELAYYNNYIKHVDTVLKEVDSIYYLSLPGDLGILDEKVQNIEKSIAELKEMPVPTTFKNAHDNLLTGMAYTENGLSKMFSAVLELDYQKIQEIDEIFYKGGEKIGEGIGEIEGIVKNKDPELPSSLPLYLKSILD